MGRKRINYANVIKDAYTKLSSHSSFTSPDELYRQLKDKYKKIKLSQIKKVLQGIDSYTIFKPVKRLGKRAQVVPVGRCTLLQGDLLILEKYAKANDGMKYLFVVVDAMSRYMVVKAIKRKDEISVLQAFKEILKQFQKKSDNVRTYGSDSESAFRSKKFQSYLSSQNMKHKLYLNTSSHAGIVERANKKLRKIIERYMYQNKTERYLDALPKMVSNYNSTYHRVLDMSPMEAIKFTNEAELWCKLYIPQKRKLVKKKPFMFKIGAYVRISLEKRLFERSYSSKYTEEVFKVSGRYRMGNINYYMVSDLNNEKIHGSFLFSELQRIDFDADAYFEIEEILKTRVRNGKKEYFVKFRNYGSKFNSWVSDVKETTK